MHLSLFDAGLHYSAVGRKEEDRTRDLMGIDFSGEYLRYADLSDTILGSCSFAKYHEVQNFPILKEEVIEKE